HIADAAQRRLRVAMVEDALRRIGKINTSEVAIRSARPLPTTSYRTGVRMLVDSDGALAYRRPRSHVPFRPASCLIAHPLVDELIGSIRCPGSREVTIRVGARTGERMVVVDGDPAAVSAPDDVRISGSNRPDSVSVHEVIHGRRLRISGGSFFQASPEGAEELIRLVGLALADVDRSEVVVDAYSGGGLFSATIGSEWAAQDGRVIAVEVNPIAAADATVNAPHAHSTVARFEDWDPVSASAVIADPARPGLAGPGVKSVVETGAAVVVLVSCDAGALGRDAGLLHESGYTLRDVSVVDMFNQTSHVEAVSRFERTA
ncbi:MAG: class I SAM-dependent RNA methyltransferase, partial [Acidimicrobiales bacterium]